jgi:hypothetical protein
MEEHQFNIIGNKLFDGDRLLNTFEVAIKKFIVIESRLIILLSPKIGNCNMICTDLFGDLLWQVSCGKYPDELCEITNISFRDGQLLCYRFCGFEETIDPNTGQIVDSKFTK